MQYVCAIFVSAGLTVACLSSWRSPDQVYLSACHLFLKEFAAVCLSTICQSICHLPVGPTVCHLPVRLSACLYVCRRVNWSIRIYLFLSSLKCIICLNTHSVHWWRILILQQNLSLLPECLVAVATQNLENVVITVVAKREGRQKLHGSENEPRAFLKNF